MGKEPSILYFLAKKGDHSLWAIALPLSTLTHGGAFRIKRLSRKRDRIAEFYIFSALLWEI